MLKPALGVGKAGEQPGHFRDPLLAVQLLHAARRNGSLAVFHNAEMVRRKRGNLGEVGDDDHLCRAGESREAPPDLDRGCPANTGIHFIEDKGRHRVAAGDDHLDGQHDA